MRLRLATCALQLGDHDFHHTAVRSVGYRPDLRAGQGSRPRRPLDRKSTRLNSSHTVISYAVFCLKKKKKNNSKLNKAMKISERTSSEGSAGEHTKGRNRKDHRKTGISQC